MENAPHLQIRSPGALATRHDAAKISKI